MPDRRWVVYKTPLTRFTETLIVLLFTVACAALWHRLVPEIAVSYAMAAALVVGFAVVPAVGAHLARRRGAPLVSPEERSRRYLAELGPIGLGRHVTAPAPAGRRAGGRIVRR